MAAQDDDELDTELEALLALDAERWSDDDGGDLSDDDAYDAWLEAELGRVGARVRVRLTRALAPALAYP